MPNRLSDAVVEEVSFVTRPAEPNAKISFYKIEDFEKKNLTQQIHRVREAWSEAHPYKDGVPGTWVKTVHDKFIVVMEGNKHFKIPYTDSKGDIKFGSKQEVKVSETITPITKGGKDSAGMKTGLLAALKRKLGIEDDTEEDDEDMSAESDTKDEDAMSKALDDFISSEAERIAKEGGKSHTSVDSADDPDGGGMPENQNVLEEASDEVKDYVKGLEAERDTAIEKAVTLEKSADTSGDESDDILKDADPALVEMIRKADARAERAETIAKAERDKRENREFLAKAEGFPHLGEEASVLGALLKTISGSVDEETYTQLDNVLTAAEAKLNESALFEEVGVAGTGTTGDAYAQLEGIAKSIQEGDSDMTSEAAFSKAMDTRPDLYERYMEEQVG